MMKRYITCMLLIIGVSAYSDDSDPGRKSTHRQTHILAQQYLTELTEDTFTDAPTFRPESGEDIPLSVAAACRIAEKEFARLREPGVDYELSSVTLLPFYDTGHWHYFILYSASNGDWKNTEPYRMIKKTDPNTFLVVPKIGITILLDGTIVEQTVLK